jgi:PTH1 family peptidyl-tRNA hydrolase
VIVVAGLGNPGKRYEDTRHNVGFMIADRLVESAGGGAFRSKFQGELATIELSGRDVLVLKPQTFMNESGRSVRQALDYHRVGPEALLVVHDELDLPFGQLRLKLGGGEAGHRGLRSISGYLGDSGYARLRVGIGRPQAGFSGDVVDYVLEAFAAAERPLLGDIIDRAADAIRRMVETSLSAAMNQLNRKPS